MNKKELNDRGMEMHRKVMNWISENHPNTKDLPFKEQDKIRFKAYKALGYNELLKIKD